MSRDLVPAPALSVVICTHNRADDAVDCARAVVASTSGSGVEVLVVDNACDAANRERLAAGLADTRVTLVREPRPGLSLARNAGLALCRAPWVAYLDDDAVPFEDWNARALEVVSNAPPELGFVAGAVHPRWPTALLSESVPPARLGQRWLDLLSLLEAERRSNFSDLPMVVGCNMLVRTSALREAGGFSPSLGRTPDRLLGGEETEIARRLATRGLRVVFDERLRVHHKIHPERLSKRWVRRRAAAEGALLRRYDKSSSKAAKVALSVPYLATLSALGVAHPAGGRDHDAYVRLWHNLGFLKAAISTAA